MTLTTAESREKTENRRLQENFINSHINCSYSVFILAKPKTGIKKEMRNNNLSHLIFYTENELCQCKKCGMCSKSGNLEITKGADGATSEKRLNKTIPYFCIIAKGHISINTSWV